MRLLRRVRMRTRLLASFGFVLALLAATVAVSLVAEAAQNAAAQRLRADDATMQAAQQVKFRITQLGERQASWALAIASGIKAATESDSPSRSALDDANAHFSAELQTLTNAALTAAEKDTLNTAIGSYLDFSDLDSTAVSDYQSAGGQARGQQLVLVQAPLLISKVSDGLDAVLQSVQARQTRQQVSVESVSRSSRLFAGVVGGVGIGLCIWLAVALTRSVTGPLRRLQARLEEGSTATAI